jgi:membrane protein
MIPVVPDDDTGELTVDDEAPVTPSAGTRLGATARTARAHIDQARDRTLSHVARLEAERADRPIADAVFSVRDEDRRIAGRELAAAVAYRLFFLMLPLVLLVVGGLGLTASSDRNAAEDAVRESGASAAVAHDVSRATADLSVLEHLVVLGIGAFGTYFAGMGLVKTLTRVQASSWMLATRAPKTRPRLLAVVLGLLLAIIVVSAVWNQMRTELGVGEFLLALPVVGVGYAALIVLLHAQLPRADGVPSRALVPGALLVGLSLSAMQAFVVGYLARRIASGSELYGGIGTAIALLFWLYLIGRLLVLGPILDAVLWRRRA